MAVAPLRLLHSAATLVPSKLASLRQLSTEELVASLRPGFDGALRVKDDGTVVNGNHRVVVLRERGVPIDALPRERYDADEVGS